LIARFGGAAEALAAVPRRCSSAVWCWPKCHPAPSRVLVISLTVTGILSHVTELLGPSAVPVDEIIRLSGGSSGAVQIALLELDLAGQLERHAGGKVSLRPAP
jgi:predicted Rossmann fold nucleotide-binding protein DprA/Smf involved in DNA uptake